MNDSVKQSFDAGKVRLGGVEYVVRPFTADHWQEALKRLKATRMSVFDIVRKDIDKFRAMPDIQDRLLEIAVRTAREGDLVNWAEVIAWVASADKFWFRVWCQIGQNDPEHLTEEKVQQVFSDDFTEIANKEGELAYLEWLGRLRETLGKATAQPPAAS